MTPVWRRWVCESPRCHGDGRTKPMTDVEYAKRTRYGRVLYCDACAEVEPPRVLAGGRARVMPDSWLALLR